MADIQLEERPGCFGGLTGCFLGVFPIGVVISLIYSMVKCVVSPEQCCSDFLEEGWKNFWIIVPVSSVLTGILGAIIGIIGKR